MSNIRPGYKAVAASHDDEFDAFDNLPPRIRQAVAEAQHNFSAPYIRGMLEQGYTEDVVIEAIRVSKPVSA